MSEAGVEGFESAGWFGLFVVKDTPDEIVAQISDAVLKALGSEEVREQMAAQSSEPQGMAHGKFAESPSREKLESISMSPSTFATMHATDGPASSSATPSPLRLSAWWHTGSRQAGPAASADIGLPWKAAYEAARDPEGQGSDSRG